MRRLASRPGGGAEPAFAAARAEACTGFDHRGYTGPIAEKDDFALVADSLLTPDAAEEYAVPLLNTDDERIRDDRAAGAIPVSDGTWLFVAYAAS
ncbi:hypothetical protein ACLF6K_05800 [Streptomyces xanthophaeus]|uniref:hypothetical protein n=1 Tax=Streptomyces xanthophaeus TaxID=67385 RepID=UPI00398FF448